MIIGIDVSSIPFGTGVSNYTINLVRHLLKIDTKNSYKLFYSSMRQPVPPELKEVLTRPNVTLYHFRLPPTLLEFIWHRLKIFPIETFIGSCDVFHTWDWLLPPARRARLITTVNDLIPFLYPHWQHPKTIAVYNRRWKLTPRSCDHFICISEATKKDLIRLFPQIDPARISVVYDAPEEKYFLFSRLPPLAQKSKTNALKKIYGLSNFVLAQGTREPRKNLPRLINAFIKFKKTYPASTTQLAITGRYGWGQDITHPRHNCIKILGYIPEKDMVALHAAAACLAYPSLYEGFGLPLVKSMAVGTPVLTSSVSSMPEIVNGSGVLVNPKQTNSIFKGLVKVLKNYPLRRQIIKSGIVQADRFHWTTTASQTLDIYQVLTKNNAHRN